MSIWSVTSVRPRGRDEPGQCPHAHEANGEGQAIVGLVVVDRASQDRHLGLVRLRHSSPQPGRNILAG
jgi:hypothetical protein